MNLDRNQFSINIVMKHLVKIYEETKKLNSDLTQYVFSTDFFKQKEELFCFIKTTKFVSLLQNISTAESYLL